MSLRLRLRNDLYCVEWGVKLYSLMSLRDRSFDATLDVVTLHDYVQ